MGGDDAAWELINTMDAVAAQQLAAGVAAGAEQEGDAGEPMDWGEDNPNPQPPHNHNQQEGEGEGEMANFGVDSGDDEGGDGGRWGAGSDDSSSASVFPRSASGEGKGSASCFGRIEPGVLALAVSGPYVATVDTLGEWQAPELGHWQG
jgi:hypothetical protein